MAGLKAGKTPSVSVKVTDDEFDPSHLAPLKLWVHILQKGWQAGSVIGVAGVVPGWQAYHMFVKQDNIDALLATQGAAYGALAGLALTGIVGTLKFLQMDREGVNDRVYRLHYNKGQQRADVFAGVGGAVGLAAAAYLLPKHSTSQPQPLNYLGAAAAGTAAGLVAHLLTRQQDSTSPNRMFHELIH